VTTLLVVMDAGPAAATATAGAAAGIVAGPDADAG
jgi:hypothetical protein